MLTVSPAQTATHAADIQGDPRGYLLHFDCRECGGFKICPQILPHSSLQEEEHNLHFNSF